MPIDLQSKAIFNAIFRIEDENKIQMLFLPNLEDYASPKFLVNQEYSTLHELLSKRN